MYTPTLNFWLNNSKKSRKGLVPIYLRITINGSRTEISTKINIEPSKWDGRQSKIKGRDPIDIWSNKILNDLTLNVHQAIDSLLQSKFPVNAVNIKAAMAGQLFKAIKIVDCYEMYIKILKTRVGIDYAPSSYEINETTFYHVKDFLNKNEIADLAVDDFTAVLFQRLELFFKIEKNNQHNTVYKKIERFKSMLKWAYEMEYSKKDLSKKSKIKKQRKEIIFLTQEELQKIHDLELKFDRLQIIKDAFLFMCYTGLAFKEIETLKPVNLSRNIQGGFGLILTRQKTHKNIPEIPLLPQALKLLDRYKNHPKCINKNRLFPIPANQNFNSYLKEIATLAKVDKNLTTHIGRKTFATTVALRNGVPMEVVSKILGHSNMRITQESYAELQNDRVHEEIKKLSKKLNPTKNEINEAIV